MSDLTGKLSSLLRLLGPASRRARGWPLLARPLLARPLLARLLPTKPLLGLLCALLSLLILPLPAAAQEGDLETEADVDYTFGQTMRFRLQASNEEPIEDAALFFNTPQMDSTLVVEFDVEPARRITLTHELPLTQVRLAPFTTVTYWWRLTAGGAEHRVPEQHVVYVDNRFEWHQMSAGDATVNWTGDESVQMGQTALDVVAEARPRLEAIIPTAGEIPLRIYIYPGMADLRTALRLTGRDWVAAEAQPELGVILVTAVNPRTAAYDLGQSIPHEMTHLMLYDATGVGYEDVPRWFEEGLATFFEASPDPNFPLVVQDAIARQETIPFAELCETFPPGEDRARLAYAQSLSLIRYIRAQYGNDSLTDLIQAFADGADCHSGPDRVLGVTLDRLNAEWLEHEQPLSPAARFWQQNGLWVVLLGGGFALMGLLLLPLKRESEEV